MIDNYTSLIYGWKLTGENVDKFEKAMEEINEDWFDIGQNVVIKDNMCGKYIYFGAILAHYDSDEENELVIDNKLINKVTKAYNNFIKKNPDIDKIFKKFEKGKPQLYLLQNIW